MHITNAPFQYPSGRQGAEEVRATHQKGPIGHDEAPTGLESSRLHEQSNASKCVISCSILCGIMSPCGNGKASAEMNQKDRVQGNEPSTPNTKSRVLFDAIEAHRHVHDNARRATGPISRRQHLKRAPRSCIGHQQHAGAHWGRPGRLAGTGRCARSGQPQQQSSLRSCRQQDCAESRRIRARRSCSFPRPRALRSAGRQCRTGAA